MIIWTVSQIAQQCPQIHRKRVLFKSSSWPIFPQSICCQSSLGVPVTVPCCYQHSLSAVSPFCHFSGFKKRALSKIHRGFSTLKSNFKHSSPPLISCIGFLEFLMSFQLCGVTVHSVICVPPAPRVDWDPISIFYSLNK